jgi:hypothetical protein
MLTRWCVLAALSLTSAMNVTIAQGISWNTKGLQEVESNIRSLPAEDQKGIVHRLGEKPENLRAMTVKTASGRLFLVQGVGEGCGASNCTFWVLNSDYRILLEKVTQAFQLQTSTHNGLPDIVTSMHGSVDESSLSYWQFQGKRYARVACADAVYADADGNTYKRPHISPHPCGTGG